MSRASSPTTHSSSATTSSTPDPWTTHGPYDEIVGALTSWHPELRASKVFGMPCLKRSGRVIAGFTRGSMVFKLTDPDDHARALSLPGAHLFDPSGRGESFSQWVVVPAALADEWDALAYTAFTQEHTPRRSG